MQVEPNGASCDAQFFGDMKLHLLLNSEMHNLSNWPLSTSPASARLRARRVPLRATKFAPKGSNCTSECVYLCFGQPVSADPSNIHRFHRAQAALSIDQFRISFLRDFASALYISGILSSNLTFLCALITAKINNAEVTGL
jgi:hypothetical protein